MTASPLDPKKPREQITSVFAATTVPNLSISSITMIQDIHTDENQLIYLEKNLILDSAQLCHERSLPILREAEAIPSWEAIILNAPLFNCMLS